MPREINNPALILETLDRFLKKPIELVLYGRSAIALGFKNPGHDHRKTLDVDAILPSSQIEQLRNNEDFWEAQEKTNAELQRDKLYFTHIFREEDVIIQPDWESRKVRIPSDHKHLVLYRPATVDLILTKMMRDDEQDLADIKFLIEQEPSVIQQLPAAMARAGVPAVAEIQEIFEKVKPKVLRLMQLKRPEVPSSPEID